MRSLPLPPFAAGATLSSCADRIENNDLAQRLRAAVPDVEAAEAAYLARGSVAQLFGIAEAAKLNDSVSTADMNKVYKGTFSRKGGPVRRSTYDVILAAAPHGICPLCGHRIVSTLDHYLAQSRHPALTVVPINLIPACQDCNKAKLDRQPANANEQTLHPYFDDVEDSQWLFGRLIQASSPGMAFEARPPDGWSAMKKARVELHFETFGLGRLYAANAGSELVNLRYGLADLHDYGGREAVRAHLTVQLDGRTPRIDRPGVASNFWQRALYQQLVASDWYCNGGFAA